MRFCSGERVKNQSFFSSPVVELRPLDCELSLNCWNWRALLHQNIEKHVEALTPSVSISPLAVLKVLKMLVHCPMSLGTSSSSKYPRPPEKLLPSEASYATFWDWILVFLGCPTSSMIEYEEPQDGGWPGPVETSDAKLLSKRDSNYYIFLIDMTTI
jgi:hypothetical protein